MSLIDRYSDAFVPTAEMMRWIAEVVGFGVRRPGTEAARQTEEWCLDRFKSIGLGNVRREPFAVPVWEANEASLAAWSTSRPDRVLEFEGFQLPYTRSSDGHEAELVILRPDDDAAGALDGDIAVDLIELAQLPESYMDAIATARVDPSGGLDGYTHLLPLSPRLGREVDTAVDAGASGYVGVLMGMPWDTHDYYLPYDAVDRQLPALWVDRSAGAALSALFEDGSVRGRIVTNGRSRAGQSTNVLGMLPGASDEWVVIGSHHDAPWASAVEDGSGIALVLAQARFWAHVPVEDRPHNLLFVLNGAHMAGGAGWHAFCESHRVMLNDVVLAVHLEHAAAACRVENGRLAASDDAEARWWFTSRDPVLEQAVIAALTAEELDRSWVLPPEAFGEFPPTDGGGFHLHGVPLVNFLAAPVYLFDACDTIDKVHQPSLGPITRATARIIESLAGRSVAELRASCRSHTEGAPKHGRARRHRH